MFMSGETYRNMLVMENGFNEPSQLGLSFTCGLIIQNELVHTTQAELKLGRVHLRLTGTWLVKGLVQV